LVENNPRHRVVDGDVADDVGARSVYTDAAEVIGDLDHEAEKGINVDSTVRERLPADRPRDEAGRPAARCRVRTAAAKMGRRYQ
jgi:hypothetical protein